MLAHEIWVRREHELLEVAKKVYSECKHRDKSIDLKKVGDEIYDLMDEECWERFRVEEEIIKNRYAPSEEK